MTNDHIRKRWKAGIVALRDLLPRPDGWIRDLTT
jgi:hypothetical protein